MIFKIHGIPYQELDFLYTFVRIPYLASLCKLTGKTTKAHVEQIRLASLEWEIQKQAHKPNLRNDTMAVSVETDSDR
jgi:hypothetical protein